MIESHRLLNAPAGAGANRKTWATWAIGLAVIAVLGALVAATLLSIGLLSVSDAPGQSAPSSLKVDAANCSRAAVASYEINRFFPASVDIEPGTVAPGFPDLPASENTISFVNNGDSYVITVTDTDASPHEPVVYESHSGGFVNP